MLLLKMKENLRNCLTTTFLPPLSPSVIVVFTSQNMQAILSGEKTEEDKTLEDTNKTNQTVL